MRWLRRGPMTLGVAPELAQHPNHSETNLLVDLASSVVYSRELTTHFTKVEKWCLLGLGGCASILLGTAVGRPFAVPCSLLHWEYFPLFPFHILHTVCNWW